MHGSIRQSTWLYGDTAVYDCDFGYSLTPGERTCEATGLWNGTMPKCICNDYTILLD